MKILNNLKKGALYLNFALSKVEQDNLRQVSNTINDGTKETDRYRKGTLADDLIQGKITEEVKNLRARLYKVIDTTDNSNNTVKPILDSKGNIIEYNISKISKETSTKTYKIKGDPFDDYKIKLVINNKPITSSILDTFDRIGKYGIEQDQSIIIDRDIRPKFEIEKYTEKLSVREINKDNRLLEFYLSKYPNQYDRKTNLLISTIKKLKSKSNNSDLIDFNYIEFISYNDMGVKDFRKFQYKIEKFDKVVEFNGFFILKFIGKPIIEDYNILNKFNRKELEEKYQNKEFKGKL